MARGWFFCPQCQDDRAYVHTRLDRHLSLYFIPLLKVAKLGECVLCLDCQQRFRVSILQQRPPSPAERLRDGVRVELQGGTPLEMARRKLMNSGVDEAAANAIVRAGAGRQVRLCQPCNASYVASVTQCSLCGQELGDVVEIEGPAVDLTTLEIGPSDGQGGSA